MKKKVLLVSASLAVISSLVNANVKDGKVVEYYEKTKNVKTESIYKNGKLNGKTRIYSPQGKLIEEIDYLDGKKNGFRYVYDENKGIKEVQFYQDDQFLGNVEDEEIDTTKLNGKFKSEIADELIFMLGNRDGDMIYETTLLNGAPHGESKAYINPKFLSDKTKQKISTYFYEKGQLQRVETILDRHSKIVEEFTYQPEGYTLDKKLFENGNLVQNINLDLEGNELAIDYYTTGEIRSKKKFDEDGFYESLSYYPNGQIKEHGFGDKDKGRMGIWKSYQENGKIDSIAYYERINFGELVSLEKIKDYENGDFVVKDPDYDKGVAQAVFSLKDGLLDGELKYYYQGKLRYKIPYKKGRVNGIAKSYQNTNQEEVLALFSEGVCIGELEKEFDESNFSGTLTLKNKNGTTSKAVYQNGFAKELQIFDKNQKLLTEIKRNQNEKIEKTFKKDEEIVKIRRGELRQVFKNGKKQKETIAFTPMGEVSKKYEDGELIEIDVEIMGNHFKITEGFERKEPNGLFSAVLNGKKLEITFKDGIPNGKIVMFNKEGDIGTELDFVDGVINGAYLLNDKGEQTQCNMTFKDSVAIAGECYINNKLRLHIKNTTIDWHSKDGSLAKSFGLFQQDTATFSIRDDKKQGKQTVSITDDLFEIEGKMYKRVDNYEEFTGKLSVALPETLLKTFSIKNGVVDGIAKTYFLFFGAEIGQSMYQNDVRHGFDSLDYQNGRVKKAFYENGFVKRVEEYRNNQLVSEFDFQKGIGRRFENKKITQVSTRAPKRFSFPESTQSREIISNYDQEGKLTRIAVGNILEVVNPKLFKDGELNGVYTHRDNQGRILKEFSLKHNLLDGVNKEYEYDSDGKVNTTIIEYKKGRKNGEEKRFCSSGSKIFLTFWNDLKHGYARAYNNKGEIRTLILYHLDEPIAKINQETIKKLATRKVRLYKDNVLRLETQLKNGKIDGKVKYYNKKGELSEEIDCNDKICPIPQI